MKKTLMYIVCFIGVFLAVQLAIAQEKITGPWLWMIAPTDVGAGGAAATDVDSLDKASGGKVKEDDIAKNGAKEGDEVGKLKWTKGELGLGGNNVNDTVTKIGLGVGDINDHSSYALITIVSAVDQAGKIMRVGSDDSIKVWLNGKVVHKNAINRGASDFQDEFKVDLKKGDNLLLIKVSERGGGWSMFAGIQADFEAEGKKYKPTVEPPKKITGPWLWMIAPAGGPGGAVVTNVDLLDKASKGKVTEEKVAKKGPTKKGDKVGDYEWVEGEIPPTGGNNIQVMINQEKAKWGGNWEKLPFDINDHTTYSYINVVSPKVAADATMRVGSDDSIKVWLNGEVVWTNPVDRGASGFQDQFKVKLKAGNNLLLVKVSERGGGWSMFVGFEGADELGLTYNIKTPGEAVDPAGKLITTLGEIKGKH